MSKTPRLSKSGIEYLDYSWGIFSGCLNLQKGICSVKACWAKGIANHYPKLYPNGFNPTYYSEAIDSPKHLRKPSIISVGWVGEVIGYGLEHKDEIFDTIHNCSQHRFLFLTKNPNQLIQWGKFPDNCWVGVTVTNNGSMTLAMTNLVNVDCPVRFISFEPLLGQIGFDDHISMRSEIDWVIIGSQTKPYKPPKMKWIDEIVVACDKASIPVFLKNNLKPLFEQVFSNCRVFSSPALDKQGNLRQELPK